MALEITSGEDDDTTPALDTPIDLRPDLSALGMLEHEKGVVEDNYENRATLRANQMNWDPVYSSTGNATGLIAARTQEMVRERRVMSMQEKLPLLIDEKNINSDYMTGLDLIIDDKANRIAPPWVLGATRKWYEEQENGGPSSVKRAPAAKPHRCKTTKTDGLRCMLWASGRIKDDGLCRIHLGAVRKPGEDVERARRKLMQSAPYAVDVLEYLMESAESEPVRLKATTEILDRAGVRGGMDINVDIEVVALRTPGQIVQERLLRLAEGAARGAKVAEEIAQQAAADAEDIQDAEVVEDSEPAAPKPPNSPRPQEVGKKAKAKIFTPDYAAEDENTTTASELTEEELKEM
jgi:hypothetical protein